MKSRPRAQRRPVARGRGSPRGFTLAEVVVSFVILSIIVAAAVSSLTIASRGMDIANRTTSQATKASDAAAQVAADLQVATGFTERTAKAVTFTVPDRNADGAAETIRYAWSGTPGDPLTRSYNGASAVAIAQNVQRFDLSYLTEIVAPADSETQGQEQLLIAHDHVPGGRLMDFKTKNKSWCATYFKPTLPPNATSWKVTRVVFKATRDSDKSAKLTVQLREADGALKPGPTILESVTRKVSLSRSYTNVEVPFSSAAGLDPDKGLCLVVGGASAYIQYETSSRPMTPNAHWMTSSNDGDTWSNPNDTQDMIFRVYGTVTTQGEP